MKRLILAWICVALLFVEAAPAQAYYADGHRTHGANYFGTGADGAATIATNTNLTSFTDGGFVIMNYSSLTVNLSTTLSLSNRCAGAIIYVTGNCTILGTLSVDGLGGAITSPTEGVNLQYRRASDGLLKDYLLAGTGGAGGVTTSATLDPGHAGGTASNGTGGGGGGAGGNHTSVNAGYGGTGSAGSAFCGGSGGGGGALTDAETYLDGGNASANGGAGGSANPYDSYYEGYAAGGGSGNPVGVGNKSPSGTPSFTNPTAGGGGVIYLIVGGTLTVGAAGIISANGSTGGGAQESGGQVGAGGGGSGGGRIVALYVTSLSEVAGYTIRANGGAGGPASGGSDSIIGGAGGAGAITVTQVLGP